MTLGADDLLAVEVEGETGVVVPGAGFGLG